MRDGEEDASEESNEDWELSSSHATHLAAKLKRALESRPAGLRQKQLQQQQN